MAGDGCSGGEETVRVPGEAWGWETLGGEGKAEQGRGGVAAFWSMREGGDESEGRETEVVVEKATAFGPEPGPWTGTPNCYGCLSCLPSPTSSRFHWKGKILVFSRIYTMSYLCDYV
jgi:hypothetical protein